MVETKETNLNKENKMNNKFSLSDVEWVYDGNGIKVTHMLTGIETRCSSSDGSFTVDIFEALKKLEILFNAHYEKIEDRKNMAEDEPKLIKDEDYLNRRDKIEIRVKSLDLAFRKKLHGVYTEGLIEDAKRICDYITKGE